MSYMSSKPLVSVITIFLNAERFIKEAIDSVVAQTYKHWELLLVDDGSNDNSTEIALCYAQQYLGKVRYFEHDGHQKNRGKSVSRNLGVSNAKGDYIALLDADDVWLPHKLEQQVAILGSQPEAAMVYGRTQYWYSWTGRPRDIKLDSLSKIAVQPNTLVQPPALITHLLQDESVFPCTCSVLIRREVFEDIGRFEETFRDLYDDVVLFAKIFLKAPVFVTDTCWDRYRLHSNDRFSKSYSAAMKTGQWHPSQPNPAHRTYLGWLAEYLSKQEVKDSKVRKALKQSLLPYRHPILYRLLANARGLLMQIAARLHMLAQVALPAPLRRWLRLTPPVGWVNFGALRRVTPISRVFGFDRGLPIDRYYIENFLARHADDVRGRVLEIADDSYTWRFGGNRVTASDVLHVAPGNPMTTIVADLSSADHIPSDTFDCIILTQTLLCIYDVRAALKTVYRILKPGGVVLATFPGICQIAQPDMELWGDYWRFTSLSAQRLFEEIFPVANVKVETHGNVLVAIAFLHGLAMEELRKEALDRCDPDYQVSITVRAVKSKVTL